MSTEASAARQSFGKYLRRHTLALFVLFFLTQALVQVGCIVRGEATALDLLLVSQAPRSPEHVIIVAIFPADRPRFGDSARISPDRLRELIEGVLKAEPLAVGIDFDTAPTQFASLRTLDQRKLVWARESFGMADGSVRPGGVLGDELGTAVKDTADHISAGLAGFPLEHDRLVRQYYRVVHTSPARGWFDGLKRLVLRSPDIDTTLPSLPSLIVEKAQSLGPEPAKGHPADARHGHEPLGLNFAGDRYQFMRVPASVVLDHQHEQWWQEKSPLRDRVVVIGGFYDRSDQYPTPVGSMAGAELVALAVESELQGKGIGAMEHGLLAVLDIAAGVLLLVLNWRYPPASYLGSLRNGAAVIALAFICSYVVLRAFSYWVTFVPMILGLWLHLVYDEVDRNRDLAAELEAARARIRQLEAGDTECPTPTGASPAHLAGPRNGPCQEGSPTLD